MIDVNKPLYFESHVTIDPSDRLEELEAICGLFHYKVAQLYMKKDDGDGVTLSDLDQFMTGHSKEFDNLIDRQSNLVNALSIAGFGIRRYKIEAVIQDSRVK